MPAEGGSGCKLHQNRATTTGTSSISTSSSQEKFVGKDIPHAPEPCFILLYKIFSRQETFLSMQAQVRYNSTEFYEMGILRIQFFYVSLDEIAAGSIKWKDLPMRWNDVRRPIAIACAWP